MHRISAALACLAVVVTAGCGTARATTPRHPAPLPCRRANNVITQADSGKTYCVRVGDQVTLEDIGSLNGTFVNRSRRLDPGSPVVLKDGDEIIVGKTFFKFSLA